MASLLTSGPRNRAESMTDDLRRASLQQPASRRRRKPVEIDRALGRLEVARAGAAVAGRQHFSNQGWGYV